MFGSNKLTLGTTWCTKIKCIQDGLSSVIPIGTRVTLTNMHQSSYLYFLLYGMILGEFNKGDTWRKSTRKGEKQQGAKVAGNHSYLTITLRLMLVEIFKSLFYLCIYETFKKLVWYLNRLLGAFQPSYFHTTVLIYM